MELGISGVGYGGLDRYSMNGYVSIPNAAASGSVLPAGSNRAAVSGATQGVAGVIGVPGAADTNQTGAADGTANAVRAYGTADAQALKRTGAVECQTCKNRTYQDGSNDPGVSFKAPGHVDPASSGAVVRGHEQEHVANENAKAASTGSRVVSQSVRIFTAVCPECGRVYVSGGETRTVTATDNNQKQAAASYKAAGNSSGKLFNVGV